MLPPVWKLRGRTRIVAMVGSRRWWWRVLSDLAIRFTVLVLMVSLIVTGRATGWGAVVIGTFIVASALPTALRVSIAVRGYRDPAGLEERLRLRREARETVEGDPAP